jgi:hypothetical protein
LHASGAKVMANPDRKDLQRKTVRNSAKPTHEFRPCGYAHEKSKKHLRWLLTVWIGGDYIRLTNEGGAPLATKKFASKTALREIQESRVSDTRTAPKPQA